MSKHALVTPTRQVHLGTVSAAAVDVAGRDAVWLDTSGDRMGIRVPVQHVDAVWRRALLMAGAVEEMENVTREAAASGAGADVEGTASAPGDGDRDDAGGSSGVSGHAGGGAHQDEAGHAAQEASSGSGVAAKKITTRRRAPRAKNDGEV